MKDISQQLLRFGLIGAAATATHFIIALLLIGVGVHPLWANAWAFLIAFQISFFGHRSFTFRNTDLPLAASASRFAITALLGFGLGEGLLAALLVWTSLSDRLALLAALGTVAILTFLMGRFWAFAVPKPVVGKTRCFQHTD